MMNTSQKLIALLSGAALLSVSSLAAQTATTAPVGYVTQSIKPASFNLIGVNLSNPVVASGAFESADASSATDAEGNFSTALSSGDGYVLSLTSNNVGVNTGVSASSATTITTDDDLSSFITAGTTYEIRKLVTIADLFGASNSAELAGATAGNTSAADFVWIPDGAGGFTKIYYNGTSRIFPPLSVGWKSTLTGNADASATSIYYTSGAYIQVQRAAFDAAEAGVDSGDLTSKELIFSGSVISQSSEVVAETGFNTLNRIFPGDLTLGESLLETDLAQAASGDTSTADIVWVPDGSGGYNKYYYNGTSRTFPPLSVGWKSTLTGNTDASAEVLTSAFFIERKGSAIMVTMPLPSGVSL